MNINTLEYITAIAEEGSISRAAQKLFLSQPALSKALAAFEKELNVQLFSRFRDRMVPTAAGKIYMDAAKKMTAIWNETQEMINQVAQRIVYPDVRIGVNNSTAVNEMMMELLEHMQTEMPIFYDVDSVECTRMLREGRLDVVSLAFPDGIPDDLQCLLAEPDELAIAVPTTPEFDYINMKYIDVLPAQVLCGTKALRCRPDSGLGILVDRYLSENNITLNSMCFISILSVLIMGVENGTGLAMIHRTMLKDTTDYRIYTLDPPCKYEHYLCIKKGADPSPKVKRIVNLLWNQKVF